MVVLPKPLLLKIAVCFRRVAPSSATGWLILLIGGFLFGFVLEYFSSGPQSP
jgi:uncharacterized membrane protein YedE/YeeE